jgi:hypothetical protein
MILSFRHKESKPSIIREQRGNSGAHAKKLRNILAMLDVAARPEDMICRLSGYTPEGGYEGLLVDLGQRQLARDVSICGRRYGTGRLSGLPLRQ